MRMKYLSILIICLVISIPSVYADSNVERLQLNWQNGEMVLTIAVAGTFQFSHQIEAAKDGRPFRVIVDLFPATHMLGQKSFLDLPPSPIKSIRTSQYAVDPVNTVRVVLDLEEESVYRIAKEGDCVRVYLPDNENSSFPGWSSSSVSFPGTKAVKSNDIAVKTPALVPPAKSENKAATSEDENSAPVTSPPSTMAYYQPKRSSYVDMVMLSESSSTPAAPPTVQPVQTETPMQTQPVSTPSPEVVESPIGGTPPNSPESAEPVKSQGAVESPATAATEVKPAVEESLEEGENPSDYAAAEEPSEEDQDQQDEIQAATDEAFSGEGEEGSKSTSRFRRTPAFPAKLKGTIVAEFPKRMVINYAPGGPRDPFETLLKETKGSSGPIEERLLDIETARLVGILESVSGENRALVEDLDGYGYILRTGDRIKKGYVSQIFPDKALFQIFEYGWSRSAALNLNESE
jgi:hypothetical protein